MAAGSFERNRWSAARAPAFWRPWLPWGAIALLMAEVCLAATTQAADFQMSAPVPVPVKASMQSTYDWTGAYVGAFFGYGGGSLGAPNPVLDQGVVLPATITGLLGGYEAGWNVRVPGAIVLGGEADVLLTSPIDVPATAPAPFHTRLDYLATIRGRVGYAFGAMLPYATAGVAWGQTSLIEGDPSSSSSADIATSFGWVVGAGIAFPIGGHWTGRVEYDHVDLRPARLFSGAPVRSGVTADPNLHALRAGLDYTLGDLPSSASWGTPPVQTSQWNVHGQTTFIEQGYPPFRSPYEGANSLPGSGQARETWTATGFLGWRLWSGGELYFDPELDQGFGLAGTHGLAGFPNGEAQKGGSEVPKFRPQRYFLRETIGLGGAQETVEDGPNQLSGKRDVDRITITVGRFAVGDFFDTNAYAHDPRADFMNWALWEAIAYDFPADLPGFTRGAVVELNRKDWAVRAGIFQVPSEPNSDVLVFRTGGVIVELEERYSISDQSGKLRLGAWANRGFTGNYEEALAVSAADPLIDINTAMVLTRTQRPKYGLYANLEQAISKDVGVFARVSWNDGRNEILSFTDVDASVSAGVSVKGSRWGRADDTVGFGAALDAISASHRDFLAAGGLGLLIGDGRLNYREEKILEAYYALKLQQPLTLTFDYQFVADPAYNADRGPVSLFTARVHAEF
jgi:high affinity Mn2+ porin